MGRLIAIVVVGVIISAAFIWMLWNSSPGPAERAQRKAVRRALPVDAIALERAREMYLGYDDTIGTIERLLAADESGRLFLTEGERTELAARVATFNKIRRSEG